MSIFAAMALEREVQRLAAERDAALARAEEAEAALAAMTKERDCLRIAYDDQAAGRNKAEAALAATRDELSGLLARIANDSRMTRAIGAKAAEVQP